MNTSQDIDQSNYLAKLLGLLALILVIRVVSLWFNNSEPFFDESQYWFWAQEPAFGYFSKPPVLAWIIAITTGFAGSDSAFAMRLSAPLFHIFTAIFIYLTTSELFDKRTAFWAGLVYATMPAVSLSSTIISTDVPLLFFWSVSLYLYVRFNREPSLQLAIMLGISIGLGFMSKYAMAYFLGCAIIHALLEQRNMTALRYKLFWVSPPIALLIVLPNILWNMQNAFVTVSHTGENIGWQGFDPNWVGLGEFVGSQFGVFGPILFGMFLATLWQMRDDSISREHRLLVSFSVPVIALIIFQAVISKAYANWAAVTYIAATILVTEIMVNRIPWHWMRTSLTIHGVVFICLAVAVCFAGAGQLVLPNGVEPFARTQGASAIAKLTANTLDDGEYDALLTTDRKLSALMSYNLRERPEKLLAWRKGKAPNDHYQLVSAFQDAPQDSVLLLSRNQNIEGLKSSFASSEYLGAKDVMSGEIRKIHFYQLEGYKPE